MIPPVLVRERALYGTGFLPDTEQQIYSPAPRTSCSSSAPRRSRWPRCTTARSSTPSACRCATRASRRAFAARRARPGATRAGSSACTSSTRSRCSASSTPEESAAEHERILAIEEEILDRARAALPRDEHRRRRPRQLGREEVRLRGVAAEPGALPRADLVLEHDRLPGAAPEHPRAARQADASRCTRSTAPRWRSGARSSRCSRTVSSEDGSVVLPECLIAFGAPAGLSGAATL